MLIFKTMKYLRFSGIHKFRKFLKVENNSLTESPGNFVCKKSRIIVSRWRLGNHTNHACSESHQPKRSTILAGRPLSTTFRQLLMSHSTVRSRILALLWWKLWIIQFTVKTAAATVGRLQPVPPMNRESYVGRYQGSPTGTHDVRVVIIFTQLELRGKAQRVARPAQTRLQNSRVTGPKFVTFLNFSIGACYYRALYVLLLALVFRFYFYAAFVSK